MRRSVHDVISFDDHLGRYPDLGKYYQWDTFIDHDLIGFPSGQWLAIREVWDEANISGDWQHWFTGPYMAIEDQNP